MDGGLGWPAAQPVHQQDRYGQGDAGSGRYCGLGWPEWKSPPRASGGSPQDDRETVGGLADPDVPGWRAIQRNGRRR